MSMCGSIMLGIYEYMIDKNERSQRSGSKNSKTWASL